MLPAIKLSISFSRLPGLRQLADRMPIRGWTLSAQTPFQAKDRLRPRLGMLAENTGFV